MTKLYRDADDFDSYSYPRQSGGSPGKRTSTQRLAPSACTCCATNRPPLGHTPLEGTLGAAVVVQFANADTMQAGIEVSDKVGKGKPGVHVVLGGTHVLLNGTVDLPSVNGTLKGNFGLKMEYRFKPNWSRIVGDVAKDVAVEATEVAAGTEAGAGVAGVQACCPRCTAAPSANPPAGQRVVARLGLDLGHRWAGAQAQRSYLVSLFSSIG